MIFFVIFVDPNEESDDELCLNGVQSLRRDLRDERDPKWGSELKARSMR